jgi:UDP-3-O-[3-hydroxymyristoyl] glucosamine N-acyltransferase
MSWSLEQLAKHVNAELKGNGECEIHSVATLMSARPGQISFFTNNKYKAQLLETKASAVIVHPDFVSDCPVNAVITQNPHAAYARIAQLLYPITDEFIGIHPSAQVSPEARIADTASIGANVVIERGTTIAERVFIGANTFIGKNSYIGADSRILANVTICDGVTIGERVLLHPGVVIGADGFGQAYEAGAWVKIPQIGGVRLGNDVEIGANTTVDRGALEDTVIEDGVKLDNQIQIAHNVHLGAHTIIAAGTGISGSTKVGHHCMIAGMVGIAGHLTIADKVNITGKSLVTKSLLEPGSYSSGIPVENTAIWHRVHARIKKLDNIAKRLLQVEKKLEKPEE